MSGKKPVRLSAQNKGTHRLGAIPLLALLSLSGMPLGQDLASREARYSEQLAEETFLRAGQIGLENTWLVAATLGGIYVAAAISVFRKDKYSQSKIPNYWPLIGLVVGTIPVILWSAFKLPIFMNIIHFIGVAFVAASAGRVYSEKPDELLKLVAYTLGINVLIHTIVALGFPSMATNFDGRWAGLTSNPNTLGLIASLAAWAIATAFFLGILRPVAALMLLAPSIMALYGSGSATATACGLMGIAFAGVLAQMKRARVGPAVTVVVVFLTCIIAMFWSDWIVSGVASAFGKTPDLSGRDILWRQGIQMISLRPLIGWGYDNHASVMLEMPLPYGNFHNGYIDLGVRGGLIAITLLIALLLYYLGECRRVFHLQRTIMFSYIMMFLTYNITEVSIVAPRNPSWLLLLVWYFASNRGNSARRGKI